MEEVAQNVHVLQTASPPSFPKISQNPVIKSFGNFAPSLSFFLPKNPLFPTDALLCTDARGTPAILGDVAGEDPEREGESCAEK